MGSYSKHTNYNWYNRHFYAPRLFLLSCLFGGGELFCLFVCLGFVFLLFSSSLEKSRFFQSFIFIVFIWNHFEMRLLNLRIIFLFIYCGQYINPWRSGQRRWVSTVPGEHCQKIAVSNPTRAGKGFTSSKTWCGRQQLWKAAITGDTVTRLGIPIRGRGKSPEEGQRWNLAET